MTIVITRFKDLERIKKSGNWIYIAGRRKVGKTFLVEKFLNYDEFFFVNRDNTVFDKIRKTKLSYDTFKEIFLREIGNKSIVIDEFHRLPKEFFDLLHSIGRKGKLIVISSTLFLSKKLLGKGSPLLGLFNLVILGLIEEEDIIKNLKRYIDNPIELIESSIFLREPILLDSYYRPIRDFVSNYLYNNKYVIEELIGEIFTEEGRKLSEVYKGIMRAVASGKNISTEISSYLYSRKLIPKDNPGLIQKYLNILTKIGILERIEVYNRRKYRYFHVSPLLDLHFYLDEKYSYVENEIPLGYIKRVVDYKIPFYVEKFFRDLISKIYGLKKVIYEDSNLEIDIFLLKFKKIEIIGEVKWEDKIKKEDINKTIEKFSKFKSVKKLLIVKDRKSLDKFNLPDYIEVLDSKDIINSLIK